MFKPHPITSPTAIDAAREAGAFSLWEEGIYGEGVTVAVLDSGMNEDGVLRGSIAWRVDLTGEDDAADYLGHGTKMGQQVVTFAPKAQIVSVKVLDKNGLVTRERLIEGLEFCAERHPDINVVNISLGIRRRFSRWTWCTSDRPCSLCSKTNEVVASGLIVVAAAGNRGRAFLEPRQDTLTCPGNSKGAFTVAAAIRGSNQESSLLKRISPLTYYKRGGLEVGTSFAAAAVSGGIALLLSAIPTLMLEEIEEASKLTATRTNDSRIPDAGHGNWYRTYKLTRHLRDGKPFDLDRSYSCYQNGLVLREAGDNLGSLNAFREATEYSPTGQVLHNELGLAYLKEGMDKEALESFQEAVRLHWPSAIPYENLGLALERLGRKDEALRCYESALHLDPKRHQAVLRIWHLMQDN